MAKYIIEDTTLKAIADSIRAKKCVTEEIKVADMPTIIDSVDVADLCEVINGLNINLDFSEGDCAYYAPNGSLVQSAIIMKPYTLLPENIAKDVEIAGVVGTLEVEQHTMLEDMELELNLAEGNQELSVPDGYAVKSAVIKKPDTLIPENIAEGIEIAGVVGTFKGGGGSVEGFATVTFINGDTVVYTRPVYIGDDCPDPVTQGRIEAPTKESTAQYDYTHSGWASADGGTADDSVLKNIQGDTVVYSAFAESERLYTIRFLDGETVLQSLSLAYGTRPTPDTPTHTTDPDHYVFDTWNPTISLVTGDTDYSVVWKEKLALYDYTWEELDAMSLEEMKEKFTVGEKSPKIANSNFYRAVLLGFENMELADGSGKARMVFGTPIRMSKYYSSSGYLAVWGNGYDWAACNYRNTESVSYVQENYPELFTYGKPVKVKYTAADGTIQEVTDTVFAPSLSQMGYTNVNNEGEKFDLFTEKVLTDVLETLPVSMYVLDVYTRTLDSSNGEVYCIKQGIAPHLEDTSQRLTPYCCFCI